MVCRNCKKEIKLINENDNKCPSCGIENPFICINCQEIIQLNKTYECSQCGFYVCDKYGSCKDLCKRNFIQDLLVKSFNEKGFEYSEEELNKLIKDIFDLKNGKVRNSCPYGVPISYARDRIRQLLIKLQGKKVRDDDDYKAFLERVDSLFDQKVGKKFSVNSLREDGQYGQEVRDVLNLGICEGKYKLIKIYNKDLKKEISYFERIKGESCVFYNDEIIELQKICRKCSKIYNIKDSFCNDCVYEKNTKYHKKGEKYILVERKSHKVSCQCKVKDFIQIKEEE